MSRLKKYHSIEIAVTLKDLVVVPECTGEYLIDHETSVCKKLPDISTLYNNEK